MRIGVIGSGAMGGSLGRLLGLAGHDVTFSGASDPITPIHTQVGGADDVPVLTAATVDQRIRMPPLDKLMRLLADAWAAELARAGR